MVGFPVRGQSVTSVTERAPANSCFAVAGADVAATCEAFQRTALGQTLCGPDFRPLIDELRRREMAGPLYLRPIFGFDWSELEQLQEPGGLFIFPLAEGKMGVAWIFSTGSRGTTPELLAAATRYFASKGFRGSTLRRNGAALTLLHPTGAQAGETPRALFAARDFYGAANSLEAVEALLAVQPDRSLAADAAWQRAAAVSTDSAAPGDVTLLVRPMELWELARPAGDQDQSPDRAQPAGAAEADEQERDPLAASRRLGFDGVQAWVARARFSPQAGFDWRLDGSLLVPRPFEKALRLLELRQGPTPDWPDWIDADVTSASFWRWDFPLAMEGYGNVFDEANEPGPDGVGLFQDMLDGLRDDPEGVQVDLRRDVFEQLGPDVLNVTDRRGAQTEEQPEGDRTLYVAAVRDVPRVVDALKRFYRGDERVQYVRSGDYEIWTVPEGSSLFVEGESDSVVSVRALAVGRGKILFGTDVDLLKSALASSPSGARLADDAAWSRLWRSVGTQDGGAGAYWSLARLDQWLEPGYRRATSKQRGDDEDGPVADLWRTLLFGTADEQADVPYAAAPPYGQVRSALPPTGIFVSEAPSGFSITISALGGQESP